jgi:hypothetical protein
MYFPPINLFSMPNMNDTITCSTCKFEYDTIDERSSLSPCYGCCENYDDSPNWQPKEPIKQTKDDGKTTACYDIPEHAKTLDDLIEHKNMPFWLGTIFKVCYAFEERSTRNIAASQLRELNKIGYYQKRGLDILIKDTKLCNLKN